MTEPSGIEAAALKPCPFCGHEAEIERYGDRGRSTIYQCTFCSCNLETGEEWGHGRVWNERASPAASGDLRERITGTIRGIYGVGVGTFSGGHQDKSINRAVDAILAALPGLDEQAIRSDERERCVAQGWRAPPEPLAWDHPSNRNYEPVEQRAEEIYNKFIYDGPGEKPKWQSGGNANWQDEARVLARREIAALQQQEGWEK
jgi:hypothetical protein